MPALPKKVAERLSAGVKRFQPIIAAAKTRDVNESDTVIIVTDVLADLFGYDKYSEITSEHAIKGTFCDLAVRLDGAIRLLIEVKAIGLELKDAHVKQAIDYAANQGVDWVVLTNGQLWRTYKVAFTKPIEAELVFEVDLGAVDAKSDASLTVLFTLSKEGWQKSALGDFHEQRQALSRFFLGALLLTDPIVDVVRRELRRVSPDVRIESEQIREVLLAEVLKRDVVEGERAEQARKRIKKVADKALRAKAVSAEAKNATPSATPMEPPPIADDVDLSKPTTG
jgi:hypothetical protein